MNFPNLNISAPKKIDTDYYALTIFPDLLFLEAFSSWDETVAEMLLSHVYEIVGTYYQDKTWALLSDATLWHHSTPSVAERIASADSNGIQTSLKYHAMVSGGSALKEWQMTNMTKPGGTVESRIFDSLADAKAWVAALGFTVPDGHTCDTPQ